MKTTTKKETLMKLACNPKFRNLDKVAIMAGYPSVKAMMFALNRLQRADLVHVVKTKKRVFFGLTNVGVATIY